MKMNGGQVYATASAVSIGADATSGGAKTQTTAFAPQPPTTATATNGTPESTTTTTEPLLDELELIRTRSARLSRPPLVICGPSGVGKGTLIGRLVADHPRHFGFSVSHTTRGPRPGEVDGVSYHFTTREAMEPMVARGLFLEHAEVHGNMYGTSAAAVLDVCSGSSSSLSSASQGNNGNGNGSGTTTDSSTTTTNANNNANDEGRVCVLDIDVQGAAQLKRSPLGGKALFVFVAPPSLEELERRLRGRGTETEDRIARRLAGARAELAKAEEPGFFDEVIVNDDLDRAYASLLRAVQQLAPPGTLPRGAVEAAEAAAEAKKEAAARRQAEAAAAAAAAATAVAAVSTTVAGAGSAQKQQQQQQKEEKEDASPPLSDYLSSSRVDAALREALLALARERPADPLRFLGEHLLGQHEAAGSAK